MVAPISADLRLQVLVIRAQYSVLGSNLDKLGRI